MRTKINKLIWNNLNMNGNEMNAIVWRWLAHKTKYMKDVLSLNKDDDIFIAMAAAKEQRRNKRFFMLRGQLARTPRNTRHFRRICLVTGRTRGVHRYFGLSRIQIKRAAKLRIVAGLRKSSW